jgi:hemerythrin-like metal-binding protein
MRQRLPISSPSSNRSASEPAIPASDPTMPIRVPWEADFSVGEPRIDAQHRELLAQCDLLADCCGSGDDEDGRRRFDEALERLRTLAREHFAVELALLAGCAAEELEDHALDCDEFELLVDEIATTENFSRLELQRFLALWWLGHVRGTAGWQRAAFSGNEPDAAG